jgi:hypothetical protein
MQSAGSARPRSCSRWLMRVLVPEATSVTPSTPTKNCVGGGLIRQCLTSLRRIRSKPSMPTCATISRDSADVHAASHVAFMPCVALSVSSSISITSGNFVSESSRVTPPHSQEHYQLCFEHSREGAPSPGSFLSELLEPAENEDSTSEASVSRCSIKVVAVWRA